MATEAPSAAAVPPAGSDSAPRKVHPTLVTVAVSLGSLMGALDMSIVNVALPYIRANLGATFTEIAWISTAYIIAMVIVMPITAWLSLTFGRKRVYMFSLALFTGASFLCGAAGSLAGLVLFRTLQGLGAGVLQPTQQAILRETYPPQKQAMAMGLFGIAVMIGPAVGPTLGGWITDNYNWPWIFYINVPIGILALWLVDLFIHDPEYFRAQKGKAGVDGVGICLLAVGLAALQTVLEEGDRYEWFESNLILALSVIASAALAVFIWWELRVEKPAVDLRILKNASFATGTFIGGILGVSLFASMFLLPLFMQELLGYPATDSGIALMPRALVMILFMPVAGTLYNRLGPKLMIGTGLVIAGIAPVLMGRFTLDTAGMQLAWPQVLQGLGFTFIFVALSTTALAGIEKQRLTSATGLYNLVRQLGGSFGTAIFATLLTRYQQASRAVLVQHLTPYNREFTERFEVVRSALVSQGVNAWDARMKALKLFEGMVEQQAAVLAFERAFMLIGILFLLCLPLVLLLKTPAHIAKPRAGGSQ